MNEVNWSLSSPLTSACPSCSAAIDVMTAKWCTCLTRQMSLLCPSCETCFCKAPDRIVRAFWNQASETLVHRRTVEQKRRAAEASKDLASAADVLIVDDDEDLRAAAAYMVGQMGYSVATASNAEEALAMIGENAPRIVLTDALMPRLDGRQMCRYIKALNSEIKVVIMTSLYTSTRYRNEAYKEFHVDEYLAKPIDYALLQSVFERLSARVPRQRASA